MPDTLSMPGFVGACPDPGPLRRAIEDASMVDETACVKSLLKAAALDPELKRRATNRAKRLVRGMRRRGTGAGGLDAFMREYGLSNHEGVVLMCLAESLLRIPDAETASRLIRDKLTEADWARHLGRSDSAFVNASTWALMLTGRLIQLDDGPLGDPASVLGRLVAKSGEPVIREAMTQAMRIIGHQFVLGRTIEEALERSREEAAKGYRYSYDMLGEAAMTARDADRNFDAYAGAIAAVGEGAGGAGVVEGPGLSVKLSALDPRFELAQRKRVLRRLAPRVTRLARLCAGQGLSLCIDAEEAEQMDLTLDVFEAVSEDPGLKGWDGLGLAVQTYLKRAPGVIRWLADLGRRHGRRLMVRLVKGAYWDREIKRAQQLGLAGYPVFTRKVSTDVSYIACAKMIFDAGDVFYPQFATHNAHTCATVLEMAGGDRNFEFQRLHGMGEDLYDQLAEPGDKGVPCRIYAPVGGHEDLLAYLARRLLENGANTSFVNRIQDATAPVGRIVADPADAAAKLSRFPHPRIPLPAGLYGPTRKNSKGLDLSDPKTLRTLGSGMAKAAGPWRAAPLIGGAANEGGAGKTVLNPADRDDPVGTVIEAAAADVERAVAVAHQAAPAWARTPVQKRAACLDRAADLLEKNTAQLMAYLVREAGKTLADALAEVREAVDFCRYYAARARHDFAGPEALPGPTGEDNRIGLHGRGVFACISPWNFPLAIFTGQVTAALAAGNAVIAKPAEETPLIADRAVRLFWEAGVPDGVLHLLPGAGPAVGGALAADPRIAGIAFTGSEETARKINRALAARPGPIVPLIAETGGQNAMIVDSSALPEQVVADVVRSAFHSAGQRCSALRVLFVQDEIAGRVADMLAGAVMELCIGDPALLSTDVGPVITEGARRGLRAHARRMGRDGKLLVRAPIPKACARGTFFAPRAFLIDDLGLLTREVFGPILHVLTYDGGRLDSVIEAVNATGYGLTLGVHSRIDGAVRYITERLRAGNAYVNRDMIGAVVGVQPFGGEGLSGTGPKAGGPRYLHRFATERVVSTDTTASGGNADLLSLSDDAPE